MKERDSHFSSRRAFLGRSALVGGAVAVGALALPALPAHAQDFSISDGRLLGFLLEVQMLQSEFFTNAALTTTADGLTEVESNTLNTITQQDGEQERWCKIALHKFALSHNGLPNTLPGGFTRHRYKFAAMNSRDMLLREALRLKTASASAWMGAAGEANSGEIASAFAALAGIQSRHRALLAHALEEPVFMAMAPTLSMSEARSALARFGFDAAK